MKLVPEGNINELNNLDLDLSHQRNEEENFYDSHHKKPGDSRRRQKDRSRDAQERLLAATIDILMTRGYAGLTTKEVAKSSGLSNGALVHHFATKAELVVAATASVYEAAIQRGQRVAKSPEASQRPIEGFITDCLSVYFDWPFLVALEIIVLARTDEALRERILPVMDHYRRTTNELWLKVFEDAGMSPAQSWTVLNLTLNLIRGMAVNRMWSHDDKYYETCLSEWVNLVTAHIKQA